MKRLTRANQFVRVERLDDEVVRAEQEVGVERLRSTRTN